MKISKNISNEHDKDEFYTTAKTLIENAIWTELINNQHDHLEVELSINAVDNRGTKNESN